MCTTLLLDSYPQYLKYIEWSNLRIAFSNFRCDSEACTLTSWNWALMPSLLSVSPLQRMPCAFEPLFGTAIYASPPAHVECCNWDSLPWSSKACKCCKAKASLVRVSADPAAQRVAHTSIWNTSRFKILWLNCTRVASLHMIVLQNSAMASYWIICPCSLNNWGIKETFRKDWWLSSSSWSFAVHQNGFSTLYSSTFLATHRKVLNV